MEKAINLDFYIDELGRNSKVFEELLNHLPHHQIHWKQATNKWNLLEIICHLLDEEREDFRARLELILNNPLQNFIKIDPQTWVIERYYNSQDLDHVLHSFIEERKKSIEMLMDAQLSAWDNIHIHPKVGPISAKFMLVNWVAHDYLHMRQITKLKYDYLSFISNESLDYAGIW